MNHLSNKNLTGKLFISPGYNKITSHSYFQETSFRLRNIQNDINNENSLRYIFPHKDSNDRLKENQKKNCMNIFSYGKLPKIKKENKFTPLYKSKIIFLKENYKSNHNEKPLNNQSLSIDLAKTNRLKNSKNISCSFVLNKIIDKQLQSKDIIMKDKEKQSFTPRKEIKHAMSKRNEFKDVSLFLPRNKKTRNKKKNLSLNLERKQMTTHEEKDKSDKENEKRKWENNHNPLMYPDNIMKSIKGKSQTGKTEGKYAKINQDSYLIMTVINNIVDFNVLGVFDGHGLNGHLVSEFVKNYFKQFILKHKDITLLKSTKDV